MLVKGATGRYEDWLKMSQYFFSRGIFLVSIWFLVRKYLCDDFVWNLRRNIPRDVLGQSLVFPHEERIFTYKTIVIWVILWQLTLVGFYCISSYFLCKFIMRNFMRISRISLLITEALLDFVYSRHPHCWYTCPIYHQYKWNCTLTNLLL